MDLEQALSQHTGRQVEGHPISHAAELDGLREASQVLGRPIVPAETAQELWDRTVENWTRPD